jgi:hypothetical protein
MRGRQLELWIVSDDNGFQILRFTDTFKAQHRDLFEDTWHTVCFGQPPGTRFPKETVMTTPPVAPRFPADLSPAGSGLPVAVALIWIVLAATHAQAKVVDVVEFYNAARDHYFITSAGTEIDKLDHGAIEGWVRTGAQFRAHESHVARARLKKLPSRHHPRD